MPGSPGRAVRPLAGKAALLALAGLPVGGAAKRAAGAVGRVSGWAPGGAPGSLWWGLSAACSCWAPVLRAGDTCIQELILPPSGHGPEAQPRCGHRGGARGVGVAGPGRCPLPCYDGHTGTASVACLPLLVATTRGLQGPVSQMGPGLSEASRRWGSGHEALRPSRWGSRGARLAWRC